MLGLSTGDAESRQVQEPEGGQVSRGFLAAPFQFAARQTLPCFAWAKPGMDRRRVGIPSHIYGRDPARVALMVAGTETQTTGGIGHGEAYGPEDRFAILDAHAQSGWDVSIGGVRGSGPAQTAVRPDRLPSRMEPSAPRGVVCIARDSRVPSGTFGNELLTGYKQPVNNLLITSIIAQNDQKRASKNRTTTTSAQTRKRYCSEKGPQGSLFSPLNPYFSYL